MSFEPKADSAFTDSNFIWSDHDELLRYINQLRYERLKAKAAYFNQDQDIIGAIWRCGNSQKLWRDYCIQWYRIANAIDIRLAKLKEQM